MQPPESGHERQETVRNLGLFAAIGAILAVSVVIGYFMGMLLDRWLGTDPWLMLLFIVLGLAAGLYEVVHMVRVAHQHNRPAKRGAD